MKSPRSKAAASRLLLFSCAAALLVTTIPSPRLAAQTPVQSEASDHKDQELLKKIKIEAASSATALFNGDLDTVLRYTHPHVTEAAGGEESLLSMLKQTLQSLSDEGTKLEHVEILSPYNLKHHANWLICLVPVHTVLNIADKRITTTGHLLAISEDQGTAWTFVDLASFRKDSLWQLFPNLTDAFEIPEKSQPKIDEIE